MAKKALLIGVNEYLSVSGLDGCVNDITNLRLVLKDLAGFDNSEIRVISDERATKSAIEERIEWLVDGASPGDLLVMSFSGHGAQVRDRDELDELEDRLDEILCPHDMDWDGRFITDDYLRHRFDVPAGVVLEVILDACHSGDGTLEIGFSPAASPPANADRRPRFLQPPVDIVSRHQGDGLPALRLLRQPMRPTVVLWSACASFQTAADARIDGLFNGAFTFYFCKHLREASAPISRGELLSRVRASLSQDGYTQVPELAAPSELARAQPFRL